MPATTEPDPIDLLSWLDRRRWSRRARRVARQFESDTLGDLRSLAMSNALVEWVADRPAPVSRAAPRHLSAVGGTAGPVEFSAGGRRVVAAAVWAPAWESLAGAWRNAVVTLAGAGRYHRSWVLNFRIALGTEAPVEMVLLA